ncbi:MAG: radical SAM protein [Desulfuromonas sp.]|nr:MAG: radical SAM protein [Desulfuromonas sp.]
MNSFARAVQDQLGHTLTAAEPMTIQVNVGYRCNLSCRHCHVGGHPERQEVMRWETMESILRLVSSLPETRVDITGGAPELNPDFKRFVGAVRKLGNTVQVRTNLTVFFEPGMEDLPEFFQRNNVHLVSSLPCYLDSNVTAQRGSGVYQRSIEALQQLNRFGFGVEPERPLNLVYNPGGAFLPPDQKSLEQDYRTYLQEQFGISFTTLLTIANMPIGRFLQELKLNDKELEYRQLLERSFNPSTLEGVMCRHQVCIAWDGSLSDCDFNQVLGLELSEGLPQHVNDLDPSQLAGRRIVTGQHCYGCTAGCGSSCGGALVA